MYTKLNKSIIKIKLLILNENPIKLYINKQYNFSIKS